MRRADAPIESVDVAIYIVPTETPESDGTLEWSSATIVTVEVRAGGRAGFGYAVLRTAGGPPHRDFFDHARIEALLFEGAPRPQAGVLRPDLSRPGLGVTLKRQDAARFAA